MTTLSEINEATRGLSLEELKQLMSMVGLRLLECEQGRAGQGPRGN